MNNINLLYRYNRGENVMFIRETVFKCLIENCSLFMVQISDPLSLHLQLMHLDVSANINFNCEIIILNRD